MKKLYFVFASLILSGMKGPIEAPSTILEQCLTRQAGVELAVEALQKLLTEEGERLGKVLKNGGYVPGSAEILGLVQQEIARLKSSVPPVIPGLTSPELISKLEGLKRESHTWQRLLAQEESNSYVNALIGGIESVRLMVPANPVQVVARKECDIYEVVLRGAVSAAGPSDGKPNPETQAAVDGITRDAIKPLKRILFKASEQINKVVSKLDPKDKAHPETQASIAELVRDEIKPLENMLVTMMHKTPEQIDRIILKLAETEASIDTIMRDGINPLANMLLKTPEEIVEKTQAAVGKVVRDAIRLQESMLVRASGQIDKVSSKLEETQASIAELARGAVTPSENMSVKAPEEIDRTISPEQIDRVIAKLAETQASVDEMMRDAIRPLEHMLVKAPEQMDAVIATRDPTDRPGFFTRMAYSICAPCGSARKPNQQS